MHMWHCTYVHTCGTSCTCGNVCTVHVTQYIHVALYVHVAQYVHVTQHVCVAWHVRTVVQYARTCGRHTYLLQVAARFLSHLLKLILQWSPFFGGAVAILVPTTRSFRGRASSTVQYLSTCGQRTAKHISKLATYVQCTTTLEEFSIKWIVCDNFDTWPVYTARRHWVCACQKSSFTFTRFITTIHCTDQTNSYSPEDNMDHFIGKKEEWATNREGYCGSGVP